MNQGMIPADSIAGSWYSRIGNNVPEWIKFGYAEVPFFGEGLKERRKIQMNYTNRLRNAGLLRRP